MNIAEAMSKFFYNRAVVGIGDLRRASCGAFGWNKKEFNQNLRQTAKQGFFLVKRGRVYKET